MNPIEKFKKWYKAEREESTVRIPTACCLTSIGMDGYPNARYVSLKEVLDDGFVFTGPLDSQKGIELRTNPKASLTFWWTQTEKQVRIQGDAIQIQDELADGYFKERNKESQLVSTISQQGAKIENLTELISLFERKKLQIDDLEIKRPIQWSGFKVIPKSIEFMEFKNTRLHIRTLFKIKNGAWQKTFLQP